MHRVVIVAALWVGSLGCGSEVENPSGGSGGGGGAGPGSTSTTSGNATTTSGNTTTGVGGASSGSTGVGGAPAGVGGSGGTTTGAGGDPVCPADELCALTIDYEAKYCEEGGMLPFTEEQIADARCVLETLRDRSRGTVTVTYTDHFGYCGGAEEITIGPFAVYVVDDHFEDKGGSVSAAGFDLLSADTYQACLDLPDDEVHTCFGFRTNSLYGSQTQCPAGCDCSLDGE